MITMHYGALDDHAVITMDHDGSLDNTTDHAVITMDRAVITTDDVMITTDHAVITMDHAMVSLEVICSYGPVRLLGAFE